jgi:hypothetical protein
MESTTFLSSLSKDTNATVINIQFWFIPLEIISVTSLILAIISAITFLLIVIIDKTCHTVPMMLVANSCLTEFICACNLLGMAIFALENDLKQIQYQDSLCIFRAYMTYAAGSLQYYSYLLQAIYRYLFVVYPARLTYQSARFQIFLICLTWIGAILYPIPMVFTDQIKYFADSQLCQTPFRLSFLIIFEAVYIYMVPVGAIVFIYFRMVRYVKQMSKRVTPANNLSRAERELKMVVRIIKIVSILLSIGLPFSIFMFMSFFNSTPKYYFRITYTFMNVFLILVMIALFQNTDPVKTYLKKKINWRANQIAVIGT